MEVMGHRAVGVACVLFPGHLAWVGHCSVCQRRAWAGCQCQEGLSLKGGGSLAWAPVEP